MNSLTGGITRINNRCKLSITVFFVVFYPGLHAQSVSTSSEEISIVQSIWNQFSKEEQIAVLSKFPKLETIPSESVGVIQSAQLVNRSTEGTNGGALLGSGIAQAAYIDKAFKGNNNYSAMSHLGIGVLGGLLGSALDAKAERKFIINYGVKTSDGQIREVRIASPDEFTKPVGQCVKLPDLTQAPIGLCTDDKVNFLKKLTAVATAPTDALISRESSGVLVKCSLPSLNAMMTIEKNACIQMEGKIEQ